MRPNKPGPTKKSPFTSPGSKKKKNIDADVKKRRSDKLKAIWALSSCDKVIESECYYICKEDIETVSKPRRWLSSSVINIYTDYINKRNEETKERKEDGHALPFVHIYTESHLQN
ncbi:uncharacterized protein LOC143856778 [Tasmannia lanceolata]|uniref:uncharacterized protein LOC143856778 n=1 Tax=Tasmannia lanceolata TaxID=3420 RepID=UPI0040646E42